MKLAFKFLILLMALPNSFSYDNKITIPGVSHLCRSYGYWGRCISVHKCHRYQDYAEQYSMQYCLYGHGRPPYICCTFGNTIVFPDDGHDETITSSTTTTISTTTPRPKPPPKRRYNVEELHSIVIDLPSEIEDLIKQDKITNKTMEKQTKKQNDIQLFPKSGECGPLSIGHKVYGGVEAELGEFAWLVNLEYRTVAGYLVFACAGNILNHRYVLTAAHCVKGGIEEIAGKLESLRAGDHNVDTPIDCDMEGSCIEPFKRFYVIQHWVHDQFFITPKNKIYNDIALLKTDRSMEYSFSISPICLPSVISNLEAPKSGTIFTVGGWGHSETANFTSEKRLVDIVCVDDEKCRLRGDQSRICAGGELGKDSCEGDSGGSLARRTHYGWVIEGIVSYGTGCANEKPAAYARIRNFLDWISETVQKSWNEEINFVSGNNIRILKRIKNMATSAPKKA